MKIIGIFVTAIIAVAPTLAVSKARYSSRESPICKSIKASIESSEKEMSYLNAENTAGYEPTQTALRSAQSANLQQQISSNLVQLSQSGCGHYPYVISSDSFSTNAFQCITAQANFKLQALQGSNQPGDVGVCARWTWKRGN